MLLPAPATRGWHLLPVDLQNLVATSADLGAMFLQAGQNGEITLIDDLTTVTLDVARTGFLFLRCALALLLGERSTCERQQGKGQEIFVHCIPFFESRKTSSGSRKTQHRRDPSNCKHRRGQATVRSTSAANAAKITAIQTLGAFGFFLRPNDTDKGLILGHILSILAFRIHLLHGSISELWKFLCEGWLIPLSC